MIAIKIAIECVGEPTRLCASFALDGEGDTREELVGAWIVSDAIVSGLSDSDQEQSRYLIEKARSFNRTILDRILEARGR